MNFREHQQMVEDGEIKPITGSCKRCAGWGYTTEESPRFRDGKTLEQGSGCTRCGGDGADPDWRADCRQVA